MADALYSDPQARPDALVGRILTAVTQFFAICAGLLLIAMALMSLASIVGRSLFDKPIVGDYELVQILCAMAVAMTLPFCQMIRGHVIVDFFTTGLPKKVNKGLDAIASLVLSVAAFIVCWRVTVGMIEQQTTGDASMLLNIPTWWGYVPMVPSFFLLGCAALYTAWIDVRGGQA